MSITMVGLALESALVYVDAETRRALAVEWADDGLPAMNVSVLQAVVI